MTISDKSIEVLLKRLNTKPNEAEPFPTVIRESRSFEHSAQLNAQNASV